MKRAYSRLMLFSAGILALLALAQGALAQTTGYLVTVNTSSVSGQTGNIDLQFNAGALSTGNACVTIGDFATDGTLGTPSTTSGSVTGSLATSLTINNGAGGCTTPMTYTASTVNDYNQPITFGNTISFFVIASGPGLNCTASGLTCTSGSSLGVAFSSNGSPVLTSDPSNFAGTITLNPDGTIATAGLAGPNSGPSDVTIQAAELVTIGTSPANLSFTVDGGSPYTSSQTFAWAIGSNHTLATTSPQGTSSTRYALTGWSDGNTGTSDPITVATGTTSYTANFSTSYLLTTAVNSGTDGSIGVNPASPTSDGYYPAGTPVTLTATANVGYAFSNWTGTTASTTNPLIVTMNSPVSQTANFVVSNVSVSVGTVPGGLSFNVDGVSYTASQNFSWQIGSNHTIATGSPQGAAGTRYTFTSWSDGGAISHMVKAPSTPATYTASFGTSYLLATSASPAGGGTVTPASSSYYAAAAVVPVTATPAPGYAFSGWSGPVANASSASTSVTMSAPESVTANFGSAAKLSATTIDFGTVYLGRSALKTVNLSNTGTTPLNISSIQITTPGNALGDFGEISSCAPFISRMPGTLGAGKSCTIAVGFVAAARIFIPTASTGTLTVNGNFIPQTASLTALVINPQASLSADSLSFSNQKVGTTSGARSVTIKNTGNTPLTLGTFTVSGDFAIASGTTCANGGTVQPSYSCLINVTFTPKAKENLSGTLTITDNALNSPQRVGLLGRGD